MTRITTTIGGKTFHVHFVPAACLCGECTEYTIEARRGQTRVTLGRVSRATSRAPWMALAIGAQAWTSCVSTREEATRRALRRQTFLDDQQPIPAA